MSECLFCSPSFEPAGKLVLETNRWQVKKEQIKMTHFKPPFAPHRLRLRIPALRAIPAATPSRPGRPRMSFARGALFRLLLVALLSSLLAPFAAQPVAKADPIFGLPQTITPFDADVWDYTLAGNSVFWRTATKCPLSIGPDIPPTFPDGPEIITQTLSVPPFSTNTWLSRDPDPHPPQRCNPYQIRSNLVADDNFVYFVDSEGLKRLASNRQMDQYIPAADTSGASIGDMTELAQDSNAIYGIVPQASGLTPILRVSKTPVSPANVTTLLVAVGPVNQLASDGQYLYWINKLNNLNNLFRLSLSDNQVTILASGVTSFYPEEPRPACTGGMCVTTYPVLIGRGTQLVRYEDQTGTTSAPLYTADNPDALIYSMTSNGSDVFWLELRPLDIGTDFADGYAVLFQMPRTGGKAGIKYLSTTGVPFTTDRIKHLVAHDNLVFWQEDGSVLHLDMNSAPTQAQTNMKVTGIEVTQAIQNPKNSVPLIQDRRTFVRVYAQTADPTASQVPNVTAHLYGTWSGGGGGPLLPVNGMIAVKPKPNRGVPHESFLFELPMSWTQQTELKLRAVLNPFHVPLEPNYADNETTATVALQPSPLLILQVIAWEFDKDGRHFEPSFNDDILPTYSLIRRMYPLRSAQVESGHPQGLQGLYTHAVQHWEDKKLPDLIDNTDPSCDAINKQSSQSKRFPHLCVFSYTNFQMAWWEFLYAHREGVHYYGMVSAEYKSLGGLTNYFTSIPSPDVQGDIGFASGGARALTLSAGSTAPMIAAHELGHVLGRQHPMQNSFIDDDPATPQDETMKRCGHDAGDFDYPYADAKLSNGDFMGFDMGDHTIYSSDVTYDLLSYCGPPQWISDHTYKCLLENMNHNPVSPACDNAPNTLVNAAAPPARAAASAAQAISDDALGVFGIIGADHDAAQVLLMRRASGVATTPPSESGAFSLQFFDSQGMQLAAYPFTLAADAEEPFLSFGLVVPFAAGARELRIVESQQDTMLFSQPISANSPKVSSVEAPATATPLTGPLSLTWQGADADGDALAFDLLASRDGGATFHPLQLNLASTSTMVDTSELGGGSTIFRVVANDGVNTGQADSSPVTVANKPPQPYILEPGNGARIYYGQVINFNGFAEDRQGDNVELTWSNQQGVLGSGSLLSVENLPLGLNTITLTAKNQADLTASTSITVMVDSSLTPRGPTLEVAPNQVGWHVDAGSTQPQQATLHISNIGNGTLDWVASSNAPWLKLSAASGTGDADLTLTANPAGAPADSTLNALVTVTGKAGGKVMQTINVPVSLSVGFTWPDGGSQPATPVVQTSLSQVNMVFAAGASEPQSVEMDIENVGSGDFSWSATCDWQRMTMSAVGSNQPAQNTLNGSGPAHLTLTIDPTGLEPSSTRTVEMVLNINVPGQAAQTMTIPVSVDVEALPETAAPAVTTNVFLPVVSR